jgi:RNase adapter protein RapZ
MRVIIISGTSGAGKSICLHALEDLDFCCIDNLPLALLSAFIDEVARAQPPHPDAAVGIDARTIIDDLNSFGSVIATLRQRGITIEVVFLDANDATLIKRFSETRRRHPVSSGDLPLEEAIHHERLLLKPISSNAEIIIDTSRTNVHQLRDLVQKRLGGDASQPLSLLIESFGFKHGLPIEADFVFDVRCLPNPHWEPRLRPLSGRDTDVCEFLASHPEVQQMFEDIYTLLIKWIPHFERDRRSYMTIAIGCTGGQHRSVWFVEQLAARLQQAGQQAVIRHRELA